MLLLGLSVCPSNAELPQSLALGSPLTLFKGKFNLVSKWSVNVQKPLVCSSACIFSKRPEAQRGVEERILTSAVPG